MKGARPVCWQTCVCPLLWDPGHCEAFLHPEFRREGQSVVFCLVGDVASSALSFDAAVMCTRSEQAPSNLGTQKNVFWCKDWSDLSTLLSDMVRIGIRVSLKNSLVFLFDKKKKKDCPASCCLS